MESTLHTLHRLVFSLIRISFSDFRFPVLMGGSAPLTPPDSRVGDRCMTDMPPDTLYCHSPLQTVNCPPAPPASVDKETPIPTGASPWAENLY